MNDDEQAKAPDVVHIPTVLGAVVVTYNAPGAGAAAHPGPSSPTSSSARSRSGTTRRSPPLNPGVELPDAAITVVRRSDGSGTTYVFTDYLSKVSPEWKEKVGTGKSVSLAGGARRQGQRGRDRPRQADPGLHRLRRARLRDPEQAPDRARSRTRTGTSWRRRIAATSAAAAGVAIPADYRVSVTNAAGKDAYPIASFTYLLVHRDAKDKAKGEAIVNFLWWAIHDGQATAAPLDYAPLPAAGREDASRRPSRSCTVQGKPVPVAAQ